MGAADRRTFELCKTHIHSFSIINLPNHHEKSLCLLAVPALRITEPFP